MRVPIGTEDFSKLVRKNIDFVDKSLFIQDLFDDIGTDVALFIRPRRFGKTLNLSMLHHFLSARVSGIETKDLFQRLKVSNHRETMQYQGTYPVIFITFKDLKEPNDKSAYAHLAALMSGVYFEHRVLLTSEQLTPHQKEIMESILNEKASETAMKRSLFNLTHYLFLHYGVKSWFLIDEYDTPIQASYLHGYYQPMIELMRVMLGAALKTNPYLEKAVMTGILRIAKESLFSGVNNLKVYSLVNPKYSEYFGFTESEVNGLLKKACLLNQAGEIKRWYNGYHIGDTVLYNPWSLMNCIDEGGLVKPYWVNISDNQLIRDLLIQSSVHFKQTFESLLQGQSVQRLIDETMVFSDLKTHETAAWSLLVMIGYLNITSYQITDDGSLCQLAIPNHEIRTLYQQIIKQWLSNGYGIEWYNQFLDHLLTGNLQAFEYDLKRVMEQTVSHHDTSRDPEVFYHGLMVGLTASLFYHPNYELLSNRESGYGRYDYLIFSHDLNKPTLLLEFKKVDRVRHAKKLEGQLEKAAKEALDQIIQQGYVAEAKQRGCIQIIAIGLAFCGKRFKLVSKQVNLNEDMPEKSSL